MLKYKIVYSDGSSDGRAEREIECDFVNMPQISNNSMIEFRNVPNTIVFAVNPANIMTMELIEGDELWGEHNIFDANDGIPVLDPETGDQ